MLALTILLKATLIAGMLSGAGLVLARLSLSRVATGHDRAFDRIQCSGLAIAATSSAAAFALLVWRLGGEFDLAVASIAAMSPPGYAAGLVFVGSVLVLIWRNGSLVGSVLVIAATAVAGHAAAKSAQIGIVVGVHVAAAAWWTGGLMMLLLACRRPNDGSLQGLLVRFSRQAVAAILLLLAAGFWTLVELVPLEASALASPYGQLLLLKVVLVVGALSIATFNRLKLAPSIRDDAMSTSDRLRKNITMELSIIALVAVATAILTTTGPLEADVHGSQPPSRATDWSEPA